MTRDDPGKPLTRRERERLRHRDEIMEAATALFAENGYHQTTVQMIAERADFSVGYLYKHFESKEQIYLAALEFHHQQLDEVLHRVRSSGLPPLEEIHASYSAVAAHFNRYRDFMRIYHNEIDVAVADRPRKIEEHRQNLMDSLGRAVEAGELRSDLDLELFAGAILGAAMELFKTLSMREGENPFAPMADTLFRMLIDHQRVSPADRDT